MDATLKTTLEKMTDTQWNVFVDEVTKLHIARIKPNTTVFVVGRSSWTGFKPECKAIRLDDRGNMVIRWHKQDGETASQGTNPMSVRLGSIPKSNQ